MYFHLRGYRLIILCLRDDLTALQEPLSRLVGMRKGQDWEKLGEEVLVKTLPIHPIWSHITSHVCVTAVQGHWCLSW